MIIFKLATKLLSRDWRGGGLSVLVFSLILAVATVTSISLFTSRIHNSIYDEAADLLAGNAKITGSLAIPETWLNFADELNVSTAQVTEFSSMAFADEQMTLTQVKAVDDNYPLRGEMTISRTPYGEGETVAHGPPLGEVWLASRLFDALQTQVGDRLFLGDGEFTVGAAIIKEPDAGQSLFGVAPRAMIHAGDIVTTQAVQVGSRIEYALLLAGEDGDIVQLKSRIGDELGHHHRWRDVMSNNRSVGDALQRAESFLLLAGSLSVILGGAAIALAARRYAKRHTQTVALLKTLGSTPNDVFNLYAIILLILGITAVLFGALAGYGLHELILFAIGNLIPTALAAPSLDAYWTGAVTGFIALLAFAAPPFFNLRNVTPAAALNDNYKKPLSLIWTNSIGLVAVIALVYLYSRDITLTVILTFGGVVCLAGVYALSWATLQLCRVIAPKLNYSWRLGLNNLQRHRQTNALQIMIFSILLLMVAILVSVRTHLISQWQNQLPESAANHFVFNIYPEEIEQVREAFKQANIPHSPFYPMTRGRITGVDGQTTDDLKAQYSDDRMNYEREVNLTSSETLGDDNTLVAGQWWQENEEALLVSVEEEYAEGLNVQVGDTMEFSIAGSEVKAKVASIRTVQWDSMNPNFFVIFNQPIDVRFGANWLTSFHLGPEQKNFINTLSRDYPTISIIELDQTINQIRDIIAKITSAIELILALVTASGLLVLITSIQATLDMRFKESAILRTLGAERQLVRKTLLIEFSTLGALAGVLAIFGTEATLFFLQTTVFQLQYAPFPQLWPIIPLVSTLLIGLAGWLSTRKVVTSSPMEVLKSL